MPSKSWIHVRPDPDSSGWLVLVQTDQEAFEYDREHHGKSIALLNLQEVQEDHPLRIVEGPEG